jgi:hypothetical protein
MKAAGGFRHLPKKGRGVPKDPVQLSTSRCSSGAHKYGIYRMARCHKQTTTPEPTKTNVCATLRQVNPADGLAHRVEDHYSVIARTTAPTAPQISVEVDAKAVGNASASNGNERPTVGEPGTIIDNIVSPKYLRRRAIFYDVQRRLVRRESKSIRAVDVADNDRRPPSLVEPVDVG